MQTYIIVLFMTIIAVGYLVKKYLTKFIRNYTQIKLQYNKYYKQNMKKGIKTSLGKVITIIKEINKKERSIGLVEHLRNIIYEKFDEEQKVIVKGLLKDWTYNEQTNLTILYDKFKKGRQYNQKQLNCFPRSQILSSRVYYSFYQFIQKLKNQHKEKDDDLRQIGQYLIDNKLELTYNRCLFTKKSYGGYKYSYSSWRQQPEKEEKNMKYFLDLNQWCLQEKKDQLIQILTFLKQIRIIEGQQNQEQYKANRHNIFMQNLQRISKQQQKQMYCRDMMIKIWQQLSEKNIVQKNIINKKYPNYDFYLNYATNRIRLEQKSKDYYYLESRHDYIQWIFPNHYGSAFNSSASPLNYLQKEIFKRDKEIGLNILRSIEIFFDFMGLEVFLSTSQFQLKVIDEKRLKDVLLVNHHNHLRIMRILACLSVIGLRPLALKLVEKLDQITKNQNKRYKFDFDRQRSSFNKQWKIYGDSSLSQLLKAKSMCFLQTQDFPQLHVIIKDFLDNNHKEHQNNLIQQQQDREQLIQEQSSNSNTIELQKQEKKLENHVNEQIKDSKEQKIEEQKMEEQVVKESQKVVNQLQQIDNQQQMIQSKDNNDVKAQQKQQKSIQKQKNQ